MSTINLSKALNSFSGFKGAAMPTDPTNAEEFAALVNSDDGGSCWSGEAPTWSQVVAKVTELDDADAQKATDKAEGRAKLIELGLSESQVDALTT